VVQFLISSWVLVLSLAPALVKISGDAEHLYYGQIGLKRMMQGKEKPTQKRALTMRLWRDFLRLQDNSGTASDLPRFFNALIGWIKGHKRLISDEMLIDSGLV
jgi:hypothetical protein